MDKVSIIVPARNETYLQKTVSDALTKAKGDIEVIAVLDGYWPTAPLPDDKRLIILHSGRVRGMRGSINAGAAIAKGKYLLKCDAHCMFDEGFDLKITECIEPNWVVIPRRKRLNAETWSLETGKSDVDYEYLSYPGDHGSWAEGLHGRVWVSRSKERMELMLDENMSAQGSCWIMEKDFYQDLELEDDQNYGTFNHEFQEIGLKAWLSGGAVMTNKKTWYAHLHKNKANGGRGYHLPGAELEKGTAYTNKWLTDSAWDKQTKPFSWLIEKFWPVPTWPENWKDVMYK